MPLVSKVCPSDVYRVWKSGSCLRVDTTLLGFEHMTWLKGRRSYIFKGGGVYAPQRLIPFIQTAAKDPTVILPSELVPQMW